MHSQLANADKMVMFLKNGFFDQNLGFFKNEGKVALLLYIAIKGNFSKKKRIFN